MPHLPILVAPLVDVLKGKLWDGKTDVVKALCAVLSACRGLWPDDSVHKPAELLSLLLSESRRGETTYRTSVLESIGKMVNKFKGQQQAISDVMEAVLPVIGTADMELAAAETDRKRKGELAEESDNKKKLRIAATECLTAAWVEDSDGKLEAKEVSQILQTICASLASATKPVRICYND